MIEIERKFTLKNTNFLLSAIRVFKITQGYLNSHPDRTVRVRTKGDKGYLTIKGRSSQDGLMRMEWEKEIPLTEALQLLELCEDFIIEKTRHEVIYAGNTFEIDVFEGKNQGLILAEVELNQENQQIELPEWIDREVTGDSRYYNSYLSNNPYSLWTNG